MSSQDTQPIDQFHDIGTNIKCLTCLGRQVQGTLIAYHLDQKLLLLKLDKSSSSSNSGSNTQQMINTSLCSGDGRNLSSEVEIINNDFMHDYSLVNLKFVSAIEVIPGGCDIDKILKEASLGDVDLEQVPVNKKSKKSLKTSNTNLMNTSGTSSSILGDDNVMMDCSEDGNINTRKILIDEGLYPPLNIDMDKLKLKLENSVIEKMRMAKLSNLGVTQIGFSLMSFLQKTLASQSKTLQWDNKGNILVFDEIKILCPYFSVDKVESCDGGANAQSLIHVKKMVEKFYQLKENQDLVNSNMNNNESNNVNGSLQENNINKNNQSLNK